MPLEGSIDGQALLGHDCAWCGDPAVAEIEVQPARYRKVTKTHPQTGERLVTEEVAQLAIKSYVCVRHQRIVVGPPPHIKTPRLMKSKKHEQTTIFDMPGVDRQRNAIYGDER